MTLQEAVNRSQSEHNTYPDIIDSSAGLYEIPELNVVGIPTWDRCKNGAKRKALLKITTFRGISSNATHFYGKLTNVNGLITFQSETEEGVKPAFIEAVNDYRSLCDEVDKSVISCREEYEKYVNELENETQEDDEEIELLLSFIVDYEFQNSIDKVIL